LFDSLFGDEKKSLFRHRHQLFGESDAVFVQRFAQIIAAEK
jgi:hypothetical protein